MKSNLISKTLATLILGSATLFSGVASADSGFFRIRFGDPASIHSRFHHDGPQRGWHDQRNPRWDHRRDEHKDHDRGQWRDTDRQIDARQDRQHDRIEQGIRSGELTRREARELLREQREIAALEARFRADGRLSPWEYRILDRELDDASRNIRQEKHDRQARP